MVSEKIYTLRRKSGLSQEQLAEKIGVSRQAISKWEGGLSVPESEKLIAISEYFNVTLAIFKKENSKQQVDNRSKVTMGCCWVSSLVLRELSVWLYGG